MPDIEEEIIGSQSEDSEVTGSSDDATDEVLALFGVEKEVKEETEDDPSAKEEVKTDKPEPKVEKVKHNKTEVEVDISTTEKLHDHLQRSLALDKERERKGELEKSLDRAAKLAGFKDHTEYVSNLDQLEQQKKQNEQNADRQLIADLRAQAEDAGLDPDQVQSYLDNHPLVKQAEIAVQERDAERIERQREESQRAVRQEWDTMYTDSRVLAVFPDIIADSHAINRNESPKFLTAEMQSRLERGYSPLDAIMLAHADKFQGVAKKSAEQKVIKQQHLGLRSQVETSSAPDNEPQVPSALADAFEMFGLPKDSAKNYMKK